MKVFGKKFILPWQRQIIGSVIEREGMRLKVIGRYHYETEQWVYFDTVAGPIWVRPGTRFETGARGIKLPPSITAGYRPTLLHDCLYLLWRERAAGLALADAAMMAEMSLHGMHWLRRDVVATVIRGYRRGWIG